MFLNQLHPSLIKYFNRLVNFSIFLIVMCKPEPISLIYTISFTSPTFVPSDKNHLKHKIQFSHHQNILPVAFHSTLLDYDPQNQPLLVPA